MQSQNKLPKEAKPLSNAEVNQIIKQFYVRRANEDAQTGYFSLGNEQGNDLRKQTVEYIEQFNEFELNEQIIEIRRHCSEMFQSTQNLTERDFVLMWNLMPNSYEEAKCLVPGLAQVPQDSVVKMVNFLNEKRGLGTSKQ